MEMVSRLCKTDLGSVLQGGSSAPDRAGMKKQSEDCHRCVTECITVQMNPFYLLEISENFQTAHISFWTL